mgnify:FL=1
MAKKTGLGKGLDALFADNTLLQQEEEKTDELKEGEEIVKNIKIIEIEPNRDQPRKVFDNESLEELAESIKKYGVIQPIIVKKRENYYEIVAGERRWRASKKAGLTEMPCIIRDDDERKNREIALIENIQREDLNPIDKARGFKLLLNEYEMTQQELADTLGISRSGVANTIRILNLDPRVIKLAEEGRISEAHCRSLVSVQDPEKQYKLALKIIEKGESVKALEQSMKNHRKAQKMDPKYDAIFRDIEDSFQGFFGTKVKLDAKKRSGRIIISYTSNDDLERILNLIK